MSVWVGIRHTDPKRDTNVVIVPDTDDWKNAVDEVRVQMPTAKAVLALVPEIEPDKPTAVQTGDEAA